MIDNEILTICAVRYALERRTCITLTVAEIVKRNIKCLSDNTIQLILTDINESILLHEEHVIDKEVWVDLKKFIENEQYIRLTWKEKVLDE